MSKIYFVKSKNNKILTTEAFLLETVLLGDHVATEQKTTLSLKSLHSIRHRQNSLSQKTIKFLR